MKIVDLCSTPEEKAIREAVTVLKSGGMVIFPTETCYGLGVDATNSKAVTALLSYKGGRGKKAVSVAVADERMAENYVELNTIAKNLYSTLLPGPVTVVSKSKNRVVPRLESEHGTLGVRIPDYPLTQKLVAALGKPITATSANTSGNKQPYSLTDWQRYTSNKKQEIIDVFLDAGELPERQPSTVVDTTFDTPAVVRQGSVAIPSSTKMIETDSADATQDAAGKIFTEVSGDLDRKPLIFALQGELGAGKTQFAKGLAMELGITANIVSPTYILLREYPYKIDDQGMLYHIDTWRMRDPQELDDLGFTEMLKPGNVIAIEWLEKVKPMIEEIEKKAVVIWVDIESKSENVRMIRYGMAD